MKSVRLHTFAKNALLAFVALCIAPFADAKHEKNLPAETIFVAQIADASDLSKRFSAHPLATDIAAIVKKYSAHRKAQSSGEKQAPAKTGISDEMFQEAEEILKQYCGKEILIGAVKTPANAGQDAPPFSFVLLTDVLDAQEIQPDFLDLICQLFEKEVPYPATEPGDFAAIEINSETQGFARPAKTITSTFQGITLHELERTLAKGKTVNRGGWALVNKTIVFATTPNALRELVDTVQNGRKSNFADTTAWKRALADTGKPDVLFVVNLPVFNAIFRQAYVVQKGKETPAVPASEANKRYDAFGLDAVERFWVSAELTKDEVLGKYALVYSEKRGALSLLQPKPLESSVPSFIPVGIEGLRVEGLDADKVWKNFAALLPASGASMDEMLNDLKAQQGLDARDAIIENLGDHAFHFKRSAFSTNINQLLELQAGPLAASIELAESSLALQFSMGNFGGGIAVYEVRDTTKLASFIETFVGKSGGASALFNEREFMGEKIRTVKFPVLSEPFPMTISYALFDGRFLFQGHELSESVTLMERAIAEIKKPQSPLAKTPDFQRILKRVPKDAHRFHYNDLKDSVADRLELLEDMFSEKKPDDSTKEEAAVAAASSDGTDTGGLPWVSFSHVREDKNTLLGETVILRKIKN